LWLLCHNHAADVPRDPFEAALDFKSDVEILNALQWKARCPLSEFLRDLPTDCFRMLFAPLLHPIEIPRVFADLDQWIRHRLRAIQLKQWKRGRIIFRELRSRGMFADKVAPS